MIERLQIENFTSHLYLLNSNIDILFRMIICRHHHIQITSQACLIGANNQGARDSNILHSFVFGRSYHRYLNVYHYTGLSTLPSLIRYVLLVPTTEGIGTPGFPCPRGLVTDILICTIIKHYKQTPTVEALPGNTRQRTIS
jgi:hypothetical protein